MTNTCVKKAGTLLCLMLSVRLLTGFSTVPTRANNKRIVKVAFFPMEGYHEKLDDGSYAGMDVEYLESLCKYAGWEINFVECSHWDDALQLLAEHKVDLVGSAQ